MSLLDKNKIFFGLLHYIFSEQKNEEKLWGQKEILDVKNVLYELLQEEK